nr:hypothetical protein [Photobacterium leiognathi]
MQVISDTEQDSTRVCATFYIVERQCFSINCHCADLAFNLIVIDRV